MPRASSRVTLELDRVRSGSVVSVERPEAGYYRTSPTTRPNCGNVSISHSDALWKPPVRKATPLAMRSTPTVISILSNCLFHRARGAFERADRGGGDEGEAEITIERRELT